jgi:hypothetical protein
MVTPLQALIDARALLAEPEHWTQRSAARKANGSPTFGNDPEASCWCVVGAIERCADAASLTLPFRIQIDADTSSLQPVLDLCDEAATQIAVDNPGGPGPLGELAVTVSTLNVALAQAAFDVASDGVFSDDETEALLKALMLAYDDIQADLKAAT